MSDENLRLGMLLDQLGGILEDFQHQVKPPILLIHERSGRALKGDFTADQLRSHLFVIRGLSAKARLIASSVGFFSSLARGERVQPHLSRLGHNELMKILIESAIDAEVMIYSERNVRFSVDRSSFKRLSSYELLTDRDLLDQAVRNILDNAAKYSFNNSIVRVFVGLTKTKRCYISVASHGIPLRRNELARCIERGWRGEYARSTREEGSGLGLWIVARIMEAHDGEIIITPTTANSITEFKLVFPTVGP